MRVHVGCPQLDLRLASPNYVASSQIRKNAIRFSRQLVDYVHTVHKLPVLSVCVYVMCIFGVWSDVATKPFCFYEVVRMTGMDMIRWSTG